MPTLSRLPSCCSQHEWGLLQGAPLPGAAAASAEGPRSRGGGSGNGQGEHGSGSQKASKAGCRCARECAEFGERAPNCQEGLAVPPLAPAICPQGQLPAGQRAPACRQSGRFQLQTKLSLACATASTTFSCCRQGKRHVTAHQLHARGGSCAAGGKPAPPALVPWLRLTCRSSCMHLFRSSATT